MSFPENHCDEDCDKCLKRVGRVNLKPVPFLYLDKNDDKHPDCSLLVNRPKGSGYRQYWICRGCIEQEDKYIEEN